MIRIYFCFISIKLKNKQNKSTHNFISNRTFATIPNAFTGSCKFVRSQRLYRWTRNKTEKARKQSQTKGNKNKQNNSLNHSHKLKAHSVNNVRSRFIKMLSRNPHFCKRLQRRKYASANPNRVFSLSRCNNLNLNV